MGALGDAWASEPAPTAEQSSPLSLDYYRAKVVEFQTVLNALDLAYATAQNALVNLPLTPESAQEFSDWINEYESKRLTLKATAEAINMGAATVNALGGRMPELSLPRTLGIAPVIPVTFIIAVAGAATLISWGRDALQYFEGVSTRAQLLENATPDQRIELTRIITGAQTALRTADGFGLASLAPYLKWGALAALAFVAWRAFSGYRARNPAPSYEDTDDE